jgi:flagellar motility protein MotE (MotC chaperone)
MPPKKAAPVFEQMDKDLVVQLFNKIPKKQTMNILSVMDPAKSVELTEYFGRIRSTEEYELLKQINSSLLEEFETCKTK